MAEIHTTSLSGAWLSAIDAVARAPRKELTPLVVSLSGFDDEPAEDGRVRAALNRLLGSKGRASVETVANTVFPESLWNPRRPRSLFFERYNKILPRLRRFPQNRRGLYFERLTNYPGRKNAPGKNQLDHVIQTYLAGNHRRSALQMSAFDPIADLNHARRLGFPCLQQVVLTPEIADGSLTICGFYAMQYLFEKAYGNYLGLARLGKFAAHEMRLTLKRVLCIALVGKLEVPAYVVRPALNRFLDVRATQYVANRDHDDSTD